MAAGIADVPFSGVYRNYLRAGVLEDMHDGMENYQEAGYWGGKYQQGLGVIANAEAFDKANDEPIQYNGV